MATLESIKRWIVSHKWMTISFLFVLSLSALLRAYTVTNTYYINYDEGCYLWDAELILEGRIPCRDYVIKTPLLAYILAAALSLFGRGLFQGRLVPVVAGILTTGLLFMLGRKIFSDVAGILAALFHAVSFHTVKWNGIIKTETLATLFLVLSIYVFLLARERESRGFYILSGILAACASLTRFTTLVPLAFVVFLIIEGIRGKAIQKELSRLAIFLGSFVITISVVIGYLVVNSSLEQVYFVLLGQNLTYYVRFFGDLSEVGYYLNYFFWKELLLILGSVLFLAALVYKVVLGKTMRPSRWLIVLWLLFLLLQLGAVGMMKLHSTYLSQLVPVMSLMTAGFVHFSLTSWASSPAGDRLAASFALITVIAFLALTLQSGANSMAYLNELDPEKPELPIISVVNYVRDNTRVDEEIFSVNPIYSLLAERKLPFDISHPMILIQTKNLSEEQRELMNIPSVDVLIAYLGSGRVKYVILDPYTDSVLKGYLPEVQDFVNNNFLEVERFTGKIGDIAILEYVGS